MMRRCLIRPTARARESLAEAACESRDAFGPYETRGSARRRVGGPTSFLARRQGGDGNAQRAGRERRRNSAIAKSRSFIERTGNLCISPKAAISRTGS